MDRIWLVMGLVVVGALAAACDEEGETGGGGATTATTASHGGETSVAGSAPQGGAGQGGQSPTGGGTAHGGSTSEGGSSSEGGSAGQGGAAMACDEPNPDGAEIVALVNAYRQSEGLAAIPYSPSLSCVAVTHVHDLADNAPHTEPDCNLHSWSDQGSWTACCYTADHAQAMCMWLKPQELTDYAGYGYENAASGVGSPAAALAMWQNSSAHNDVILNQGMWESHPWHAVGAGLYQGYATLWFGEQSDPGR